VEACEQVRLEKGKEVCQPRLVIAIVMYTGVPAAAAAAGGRGRVHIKGARTAAAADTLGCAAGSVALPVAVGDHLLPAGLLEDVVVNKGIANLAPGQDAV
jgi:hypothetical protein